MKHYPNIRDAMSFTSGLYSILLPCFPLFNDAFIFSRPKSLTEQSSGPAT
jgi:hypothetical protein